MDGIVHAAEACALPFRAGRDRPRPGCRLRLGAVGNLLRAARRGNVERLLAGEGMDARAIHCVIAAIKGFRGG